MPASLPAPQLRPAPAAWLPASGWLLLAWFGLLALGLGLGVWQLRHTLLTRGQALAELKQALRQQRGDAALLARLRAHDLDLRQRYFSALRRLRWGGWLMLGGAVLLLAWRQRQLGLLERPVGVPPGPLPDDPEPLARQSRWGLAGASLVLAGAAIGGGLALAPEWRALAAFGQQVSPQTVPPAPPPTDAAMMANWPGFRGPRGLGQAGPGTWPRAWGGAAGASIRWRAPLGLPGHGSPIIWGDAVYVTGADATTRELRCYDAANGALRWRSTVPSRLPAPKVAVETGHAASTPATDGRLIFTLFANGELAAFDATGRLVWQQAVGPWVNSFGHASSPVVWDDLLILQLDQDSHEGGPSELLALDPLTGATRWQTAREVSTSWSTPAVSRLGDTELLLTTANPLVQAYELTTGRERWRASPLGGEVVTGVAVGGGLVVAASLYAAGAAIPASASGTIPEDQWRWRTDEDLPEISSPVADESRVYWANADLLVARALADGRRLWAASTELNFQASPLLADGAVYCLGADGVLLVGDAADTWQELGRWPLGQATFGSPALARGWLFVRGEKELLALAAPETPPLTPTVAP